MDGLSSDVHEVRSQIVDVASDVETIKHSLVCEQVASAEEK